MDDISAIFFQSGTKLYKLAWNATTEIALLSSGAMQVRQDGLAYTLNRASSVPVVTADLPSISVTDLALSGSGLVFCVNTDKSTPVPTVAGSTTTSVQQVTVPVSVYKVTA